MAIDFQSSIHSQQISLEHNAMSVTGLLNAGLMTVLREQRGHNVKNRAFFFCICQLAKSGTALHPLQRQDSRQQKNLLLLLLVTVIISEVMTSINNLYQVRPGCAVPAPKGYLVVCTQ